jgi:phenylacetate-CoA ligase
MSLYEELLENTIFPFWDGKLRHRQTFERLAFVRSTQWRSPTELIEIQARELQRLLQHAYANVPFYRRRFDEAGLKPADIRDARDLSRLPVMDRPTAIASAKDRTATAGASIDIKKATSGTTGMPLTIGYDRPSDDWRQAMRIRGYGWAGYRLGRRALHFWGFDNPNMTRYRRLKLDLDRFIRRDRFFDCVKRGDAELEAFAREIETYKPRLIVSYSQAAGDFARYVLAKGRRTWGDIPIICAAERLFPEDRRVVEQVFGRGVFETYGCREVMLIAAECNAHQGMHTSMENLVVEVVVRTPDGERPARPGETGEIVLTDLHNYGAPFIRYANGDLATMGPEEACPCGRGLARIQSVDGRSADTLTDGDGNRIAGLLLSMLLSSLKDIINQFQIVQHPDRSVTIRLIPGPRYEEEGRGSVKAMVEKYLRRVPVEVREVSEIPVEASGKRRIVVVERGQPQPAAASAAS